MSIEKQVKNQARAALRGNISKLIAAAGFVMVGFLLFEYIEYLVLVLSGMLDADAGELLSTTDSVPLLLTGIAVMAAGLLFSPILNGFLRMAANVAVKKDCASTDVLFYFRRRRYMKTIIINMLLLLMYLVVSSLLDVARYCSVLFPQIFERDVTLNLFTIVQQDGVTNLNMCLAMIVNVISFIIKLLVYMVFVHYQLTAYALDDTIGVGRCVFVTIGFSFKNFSKLLKLTLSFIGWFALCFFVVPAIYVLPYFAVASMMSARWLFSLNKSGGAR